MTDQNSAPERIWVRVTDKTVMATKPSDADEFDVEYIRADRAAQEPVAWALFDVEGVVCAITTKLAGHDAANWTPLYAAPPTACQQEAVTVAEAAQVLLKARDALKLRITDHGIPYYLSREEEQLSLLDPIALRALKREQK